MPGKIMGRITPSVYIRAPFGSIAQLVQSICLTSRGSLVRIRLLPPEGAASGGIGILGC